MAPKPKGGSIKRGLSIAIVVSMGHALVKKYVSAKERSVI